MVNTWFLGGQNLYFSWFWGLMDITQYILKCFTYVGEHHPPRWYPPTLIWKCPSFQTQHFINIDCYWVGGRPNILGCFQKIGV